MVQIREVDGILSASGFGSASMPRLPRLHVPGGCYHVVLHGNHQQDLFHSSTRTADL
jgi:hypothetical protein